MVAGGGSRWCRQKNATHNGEVIKTGGCQPVYSSDEFIAESASVRDLEYYEPRMAERRERHKASTPVLPYMLRFKRVSAYKLFGKDKAAS